MNNADQTLIGYKEVWWRFSDKIDLIVNLIPQAKGYLDYRMIIENFSTVSRRKHMFFYVEPQIEKTTGRRKRIHYNSKLTMNST